MGQTVASDAAPDETGPPRRKLHKRLWFRLTVDAIGIYVVWCGGLYLLQDRMLFPTDVAPAPKDPAPFSATAEVFELGIDGGGRVVAWFFPVDSAGAENPAPVVIFFHGNAEIIDQQADIVDHYHRLGISVLLPEYRGYGRSEGKPSQQAILSDNIRFVDRLLERDDVDSSRVVYHGRSLGGGFAADLATKRQPAALILQSTFASVISMARRYAAPGFLVKNPLRTDRVLASIDRPVLIFHGSRDDIIPVYHGRKLRDIGRKVTYVEYDCGHNDFPGAGNLRDYHGRIAEFLAENGLTVSPRDID